MRNFTLRALDTHVDEGYHPKMEDVSSSADAKPPKEQEDDVQFGPDGHILVPGQGLYCVPIFWDMLQDPAPFGFELTELALKALLETLKPDYYSARFSLTYMCLCMQNVGQGKSVCQSLVLAKELIAQYSGRKSPLMRVPHEAIQRLNARFKLVDTVVESLVRYRKVSDARLATAAAEKDTVVEGKYSHEQNLEARFSFLEYVVENDVDLRLELAHVTILWNEFVCGCRCPTSSKYFLRWLLFARSKQPVSYIARAFSKEASVGLFDLISRGAADLSKEFAVTFYRCFEKYFTLANLHLERMETGKDNRYRAKDVANLYGIEQLWNMAENNGNEKARLNFCGLLTSLYLYPAESALPQRITIWQDFVVRAMKRLDLADIRNDEVATANLAKLLLTFFSKLDGAAFVVNTPAQAAVQNVVTKETLKVVLMPGIRCCVLMCVDNKTSQIVVPTYYSVGQLRQKLAEQFSVAFADCFLSVPFRTLYHEDDERSIKDQGSAAQNHCLGLAVQPVTVTLATARLTAANHPKHLLAQNHDHVDLLFRLLSKEHSLHASICWELLTSLPRNARMEEDIKNIAIGGPEDWNRLLDSASVHRLLYSLQIVEDMLREPEPLLASDPDPAAAVKTVDQAELRESWNAEFLRKQGGNHLFQCMIGMPMQSIAQPLTRKCFALLMRVIILLFKNETTYSAMAPVYSVQKDALIARIMCFLETVARPAPARKMTRTSARRESQCEDELLTDQFDREGLDNRSRAEEVDAVSDGFRLIKSTYAMDYNYFEKMSAVKGFAETVRNGLLLSDNVALRKRFSTEIVGMCAEYQKFAQFVVCPHRVLLPLMLGDMIGYTPACETQCVEFFNTVKQALDRLPKPLLVQLPIDHQSTAISISTMLIRHGSSEKQTTVVDDMMVGILNLLNSMLKKFPEFRRTVGQEAGLLREVLHSCLFEHPVSGSRHFSSGEAATPPKCKSKEARSSAFTLLCTLARDTPTNIEAIVTYLLPLHKYNYHSHSQIGMEHGSLAGWADGTCPERGRRNLRAGSWGSRIWAASATSTRSSSSYT